MPRLPVTVRQAVPADSCTLVQLWSRLQPALSPLALAPADALAADALAAEALVAEIGADPHRRIIVAEIGHDIGHVVVVGAAYLQRSSLLPLGAADSLHVTHLQVDPRHQRRGVGSALVEAAVSWAEEHGIESVLALGPADDREANRFLARLGMGQVGVVRYAAVATVRGRLPGVAVAAARLGRRPGRPQPHSVGQVVAARRSQRRLRARGLAT